MKIAAVGTVMTLGLLGLMSAASADEEKVPLKDVPKTVLDAVKVRFPEAELKKAAKETEGGKTTYEVSLKNRAQDVDLTITSEGKITEIETELAAKELPKAVASAIAAKYPKCTIKKAEEIVEFEGDEEAKSYEVLLTTGEKKTVEVKLSPEGKSLKVEEGDEGEED